MIKKDTIPYSPMTDNNHTNNTVYIYCYNDDKGNSNTIHQGRSAGLPQTSASQYSSCGSQMCTDSEMKIAKYFSTVHVSRTATFRRVPLFFLGQSKTFFFFSRKQFMKEHVISICGFVRRVNWLHWQIPC